MPDAEPKPEDLSFEEAMDSLEAIVGSLESERLPLERMVESYERGVQLLRVCRQRIDTARHRVEVITADLDGKSATLSEFQPAGEVVEPAPAVPAPVLTAAVEEPPKRTTSRRKPEPADDSDGEIRLF